FSERQQPGSSGLLVTSTMLKASPAVCSESAPLSENARPSPYMISLLMQPQSRFSQPHCFSQLHFCLQPQFGFSQPHFFSLHPQLGFSQPHLLSLHLPQSEQELMAAEPASVSLACADEMPPS